MLPVATGFGAEMNSEADSAIDADNPFGPSPQLDARRARDIRRLDRVLARKSRNMGPDAWYVIALHDAAQRMTPEQFGRYGWRSYATLEGLQVTQFKLVQGRADAAELIYEFFQDANTSPAGLSETTYLNRVDTAKMYEFRAFRTAAEAQAFYNRVVPD
jgi:hypothetical protein